MSLLEWLKIWCKFYRIPLFCSTEYPPPPRKLKFRQNFGLWVFSVTDWSTSRKLKFRQILGLWVFSVTEYPPRKLKFGLWVFSVTEYSLPPKNGNLGRSWDFEYFQLQNTPSPPENWNLGKSWDFEYFQLQNAPPPIGKLSVVCYLMWRLSPTRITTRYRCVCDWKTSGSFIICLAAWLCRKQ